MKKWTDKEKKNEIKTNWFGSHVAKLETHGDLQVLTWSNPDSNAYYCRYVFDGNKLYISGDIGEAIFVLTWKATIESFSDLFEGYFLSKLRCYDGDRYDFDSDSAIEEIKNFMNDYKDEISNDDKNDFENMIIDLDKSVSNEEQWAYEYINSDTYDVVDNWDLTSDGWIYTIGRSTPWRLKSYLIGLKMAYEQLKSE